MRRLLVTLADGRQAHVRCHGSGPPLVLLHESPETSLQFVPLLEELGDRFTLYAPDLPGRGGSDPLPGFGLGAADERPTIARYAAATVEVLDALGLTGPGRGPVPVFGTHTGSLVALELACAHPQHVAVAVLDGIPLFEPAEAAELAARYAPPLGLDDDGSHLLRLWARARDGYAWFPWYARDAAHRLSIPLPPAAVIHEKVMHALRSGDGYRVPFAAAFAYRPLERLAGARAPLALLCREGDLQERAQARLPEPWRSEVLPRAAWAQRLAEIVAARTPAGSAAPPLPLATGPRFLAGPDGAQLHVRRPPGAAQGGRPVVQLPGEPGGGRGCVAPAAWLVDMPAAGESDPLAAGGAAQQVAAALDELGLRDVELRASGVAVAVARELAGARPDLVAGAVVELASSPVGAIGPEPLDLEPALDGAHLLRAWRAAADSLLWAPWWQRTPAARRDEPWSAAEVHERALQLLLGGAEWQRVARAPAAADGG